MNQINSSELVKSLSFEEHPLHVFQYDGKITFLALQVGRILGIRDASKSMRQSKALEKSIDYDVVPSSTLPETDNLSFSHVNHVSVLFLSGFFLFVLRSNKDIAIPFTRWAIREAIPMAMVKQKPPELTKDDLKLMELAGKHKSKFARQLLIDRGFFEAGANNQQLGFDDQGNQTEGGEDD